MTRAEAQYILDTYIRNSAVDAFTNLRLNSVLNLLMNGSISVLYSTFTEFEAAYTASPDAQISAFVEDVGEYGFYDVQLIYFPGVGVSVAGLQLIIDLR